MERRGGRAVEGNSSNSWCQKLEEGKDLNLHSSFSVVIALCGGSSASSLAGCQFAWKDSDRRAVPPQMEQGSEGEELLLSVSSSSVYKALTLIVVSTVDQPGLQKGSWSKEEDTVVKAMVTELGVAKVKWSTIAEQVRHAFSIRLLYLLC